MDRPNTLSSEHSEHRDQQILNKLKLQGAVEYMTAHRIEFHKSDVFRHFGFTLRQGWAVLRDPDPQRQLHDDPNRRENRGRKCLIPEEKVIEIDRLLESNSQCSGGLEERGLTWASLAQEVGLEVSDVTIHRAVGSLQYRKCIACNEGWISKGAAERRVEWARTMLEKYPTPDDWKRVRFSSEVHFGWSNQGKLHVIPKPGQRYCPECLRHQESTGERDKMWLHFWTAVGWNFKSDLVEYDGKTMNGKISPDYYIRHILEPVVKPWIGQDFVLEEDGDSGHGPGHSRKVQKWKRDAGLRTHFNCPASPDLALLDNCWSPSEHLVRPHWDETVLRGLVFKSWAGLSQDVINERVISMPQRLMDVIRAGGQFPNP